MAGNAQLARHDGGVREQAPALDEEPRRRREEHDPAGIGALGDEDLAGQQVGVARVARPTRTWPRTTPGQQPMPAQRLAGRRAARARRFEAVARGRRRRGSRSGRRRRLRAIARRTRPCAPRRGPRRSVRSRAPSTKPSTSSTSRKKTSRGVVEHAERVRAAAPSSRKIRRARPKTRVRSKRRFSRSRTRARACRRTQRESRRAAAGVPAERARHALLGRRARAGRRGARRRPPPRRAARGEPADGAQERQGVVAQRGALELQLLEAAVAEALEIRVERAARTAGRAGAARLRAAAAGPRTAGCARARRPRPRRRAMLPHASRRLGRSPSLRSPQSRSFAAFPSRRRTRRAHSRRSRP